MRLDGISQISPHHRPWTLPLGIPCYTTHVNRAGFVNATHRPVCVIAAGLEKRRSGDSSFGTAHSTVVTCDHSTHLNVHLFRTTVASCACLCVGGTSHLNLPRRTSGSTRNHSPARIAPSRRAPGESQRGARHGRCPVPAIHLQARLHVTLAFPQRLCAIHPLHPSARWLPLFTRCLCWSRDSRSRSAHEHVAKGRCAPLQYDRSLVLHA